MSSYTVIADIIGKVNPSGKLPMWPLSTTVTFRRSIGMVLSAFVHECQ